MLQRLFKVEMCWKWQQGTVVSKLPPFPTRTNHLTISSMQHYIQTIQDIER